MKLTKNNLYKSKLSFESLDSFKATLFYYYQPIIGPIAISLYSTLFLESKNSHSNSIFIPVERLITILKIKMEDLNEAVSLLVNVDLLEVLQSEKEKNKLILILNAPKNSTNFEKTQELYLQLEKNIDKRNLMISKKYIQDNNVKDFDGFVSLTSKSKQKASCKLKENTPNEFIECKMNREVTNKEKDMITLLIEKYKLSKEIVNSIILYSIVKNKAVVTAYIIKIAETLIEQNINTYDKFIKFLTKIDLTKNDSTKKEENPFIEKILSEKEKVIF